MYWKKTSKYLIFVKKIKMYIFFFLNYLVIIVEIHFHGTSRTPKKIIKNNKLLKTLIRKAFVAH